MQIGQLYSCKWSSCRGGRVRGWEMLLFLGNKSDDDSRYLFYDVLKGNKCMLVEGLIRHCKEINLEEQCTQ